MPLNGIAFRYGQFARPKLVEILVERTHHRRVTTVQKPLADRVGGGVCNSNTWQSEDTGDQRLRCIERNRKLARAPLVGKRTSAGYKVPAK
jgi:hypothetical protein